MKKTCNITKKELSRAGLFVLAWALVLTTFSSLITSAKAFNEDEHDVLVEDTITDEQGSTSPLIVEVKEIPSDAVKFEANYEENYSTGDCVSLEKRYIYFQFKGTAIQTQPDACVNHIDISADGTGTILGGSDSDGNISNKETVSLTEGNFYCIDGKEFLTCEGCYGRVFGVTGDLYQSDTAPSDSSDFLAEVEELKQAYSFIGASANKSNLQRIRFGILFDESKTTREFRRINVLINEEGMLTNEYEITADTEYSEYNGKRLYLIETYYCESYYSDIKCTLSVYEEGKSCDITSISRSVYSVWKNALEKEDVSDVDSAILTEVNRRQGLVDSYGMDGAKEFLKLEEENMDLRGEKDDLAKANADLTEKNGALEKENASLKEENETLKNTENSGENSVTKFVNGLFNVNMSPIVCYLIIAGAVVVFVLLVTGVAFGVKRR